MSDTDTPDRIRARLSASDVNATDLARELGINEATVRRNVKRMPDVSRYLDGPRVMLTLNGPRVLSAADLLPVEEGAQPQAPASSRVALIEELLDIERVIEEMTARRAEIMEALR